MVINNIDLEKQEFVTDLERNIFLLSKEMLLNYRIIPEETSIKIVSETQSEAEELSKNYEHETVFLFNGQGMYEIPCKIAAKSILTKQMKDYFTQYMYYRNCVDIESSEVSMLSLFLYDLVKGIKENKEHSAVTGYSATISGTGKTNWAFQSTSSQATRASHNSRDEEKSRAARARSEIATRIEKPMNTIAGDRVELSSTAQREVSGRREEPTEPHNRLDDNVTEHSRDRQSPKDAQRPGETRTPGETRRPGETGERHRDEGGRRLGGDARAEAEKDESSFFDNLEKLSRQSHTGAMNTTCSMNASNSLEDAAGNLISAVGTVGSHTTEGAVLGAVAGAGLAAIGTAWCGTGAGTTVALGAAAGGAIGAVVGFADGLCQSMYYSEGNRTVFIDWSRQ